MTPRTQYIPLMGEGSLSWKKIIMFFKTKEHCGTYRDCAVILAD